MNNRQYQTLIDLDPVEQIAKISCEKDGNAMSFSVYREAAEKLRRQTPEDKYIIFATELGVELLKVPRFVTLEPLNGDNVVCYYIAEGDVGAVINGQDYICRRGELLYLPEEAECELEVKEEDLVFAIIIKSEVFHQLHFKDQAILRFPMLYPSGEDAILREQVLQMYELQERDRKAYAQSVYYLFFAMATYMSQHYFTNRNDLTQRVYSHPQAYEIMSYIALNYRTVTLTELAETFHFSVPYLSNLIRKETGRPFSLLLRSFRVRKAKELLKETQQKVEEVAKSVGFQQSAQFIRAFKAETGMIPAKYRRELNKGTAPKAPFR